MLASDPSSWRGEPARPEGFFSGCLHGNERVGPPTLTELAILLVENYNKPPRSAYSEVGGREADGRNPWLKRLVDTRAIWLMPTTNAEKVTVPSRFLIFFEIACGGHTTRCVSDEPPPPTGP